jgi:hypothetical protein
LRRDRSIDLLLVLTVIGALLGSIVGEVLGKSVPVLARGVSVGLDPAVTLDLYVFKFVVGFRMTLNVASAVGILLALLLFRRA